MIAGADLDHIAIAVERWRDAWPRFAVELGGRWKSAGRDAGYAPSQLAYANGMKVEILQPAQVEENDFLRRFLDRNGPGPHHFTFKLPDITAALAECEAAGYRPVNVDMSHPEWKEGFLHPKEATGVLVQLAQAVGPDWITPPVEGFPIPEREPATLVRVGHAVADLGEGLQLFAGLLGGVENGRGVDGDAEWVDLAWPGPGRIRLLAPAGPSSSLVEWLDGRTGRVHHIAFAGSGRPGELGPDAPVGTRLLLES